MPMTLEQSIQFSRDQVVLWANGASNWRSQNNSGRELCCLYNALRQSLSVAVSDYDTPQAGIDYLKTEFKPSIFDRTFELIRELHINNSARTENICAQGLTELVMTVHAAWLLSLFSEAREIASVCVDEKQMRFYQSDVLWRDYARGISAVAHAGQFTPQEKKYKGYDCHWATYLQLMADICAGINISPAIALVDQSFSQRNRDKRLLGDGLDGDGMFPVKWDFRKHSLLMAAEHNTIDAR
jgi:hypothetical protein